MKIIVFILCLLVSLKSFSAPALDDFQKAVQCYHQGQYEKAVRDCQGILQKDSRNWRAYQILGESYFKLHQAGRALEAFDHSLKIHPDNPSLQKLADNVRKSIQSASPGVPPLPSEKLSSNFISLRVFILHSDINFGDLSENAATLQKLAAQAQQEDTSTRFSADVPVDAGVVVVEPGLWLDKHWQLGIPLSFYNISGDSFSQSSNSLGSTNAAFNPSVFSAGLNARYMIKFSCFQFDASAGPLLALMGLNYSGTDASTTASGNFSAAGLGFQTSGSFSLELFHILTIGPTVGYQMASASGFHGAISGSGLPAVTGTWEMVPGPSGSALTLLPDGTPAPNGSRPFKIDISGFHYGCQMSLFF